MRHGLLFDLLIGPAMTMPGVRIFTVTFLGR
jgi:hypothetical protein